MRFRRLLFDLYDCQQTFSQRAAERAPKVKIGLQFSNVADAVSQMDVALVRRNDDHGGVHQPAHERKANLVQ
jgi:hypothetical protein